MGKVKSVAYDYFHILPEGAACKKCKSIIKSVQASNLKKHLKSCQPKIHQEIQEKEEIAAPSPSTPRDPKNFFVERKLSEAALKRQHASYSKLAAMPQISINFLNSEEFRSFVNGYQKDFKLPTSHDGAKGILKNQCDEVKKKIKKELDARKSMIALTTDAWSDAGVSSYVGVTSHYFNENFELTNCFLGLKKLPISHTGENIRKCIEEVLKIYDLSLIDVSKIITDGASNMVKAFEHDKIFINKEHDEEESESEKEESDLDSDDEEAQQSDEVFFGLLDEVAVPNDDEEYGFSLRINCIIHGLQLILAKCIETKCKSLWKLIRHLRKIITTIRKSNKAKEMFFKTTKSTLPLPGKTRWNAHFLMIEQFLKHQVKIEEIYKTQFPKKKYAVKPPDLEILEKFVALTGVFQRAILRLQSDGITSSKCYGIFRELLEETSKSYSSSTLTNLAKSMKEEVLKRFDKYIDVYHMDFDPHFILCCLFDPHEAICLQDVSSSKLVQILSQRFPSTSTPNETAESIQSESSGLNFRDRMALNVAQRSGQSQNSEESRISKYVNEMISGDHVSFNAIDYWKNVSCEFKFLQHLAFSLLAIPASSAPSERVFSQSGIATHGLKNRTKEELLNAKLIVHLNKRLL